MGLMSVRPCSDHHDVNNSDDDMRPLSRIRN